MLRKQQFSKEKLTMHTTTSYKNLIGKFIKSRDLPQNDLDHLLQLRANLVVMTDTVEDILKNGLPKKPYTSDDKERYDYWWADKWARYFEALGAIEACKYEAEQSVNRE
jgi:hypothetical protein